MTQQEGVVRYQKSVRVLHWFIAVSFVALFVTGLILFIPPLAIAAQDSWTRVIHRVAGLVFTGAPVIFALTHPRQTARGVKEAFVWGNEDMEWLKAAPAYYFLADEKAMPPQGHMNTGQKMWWFLTLVFSVVFIITGLLMWFAKDSISPVGFQWMVFIHDVAFIVTGAMFFVHLYLSVAHPLMRPLKTGPWGSMTRGCCSVEYARAHHEKWYNEVVARSAKEGAK